MEKVVKLMTPSTSFVKMNNATMNLLQIKFQYLDRHKFNLYSPLISRICQIHRLIIKILTITEIN